MPELADVEFNRRVWNPGTGHLITAVQLHASKPIFRDTNTRALSRHLAGSRVLHSTAHGKQMLFGFSGHAWLGLHLGMTGRLSVHPAAFKPDRHDHLVLYQKARALVFSDPRLFGRVRFHRGESAPSWWPATVPQIGERTFNRRFVDGFLEQHRRAPTKAVLLMQHGFPGIGNWMADEILWRAAIPPGRTAGALSNADRQALLYWTRFIARESLRFVSSHDSKPPRGWLFHQRWKRNGWCPRHRTLLLRATIGGRTTTWCSACQP